MSLEMIGMKIAALRKEKGVRQEDLAAYVGVTAQAVSKWERGGVPDTELLPDIADFFGVSMDALFGRECLNAEDMHLSLQRRIAQEPKEMRFQVAMEYCWDMEKALFGHTGKELLEEYTQKTEPDSQTYSCIFTNEGFTRMGLGRRMQYFFLMPEVDNKEKTLFDGVDYHAFFKAFSDTDVFDACVLLHKRKSAKAFTEKLLMREMGINAEKAKEVVAVLKTYHLLKTTQIEMDEEVQTVYQFQPTAAFVAFLTFAREMIQPPDSYRYYKSGREKPFL